MKHRRFCGVAIPVGAPVVTLTLGAALLFASSAGTSGPATHFWVMHGSSVAPPVSRTLGCPDTHVLNGYANPGKDFLCGTNLNDRIVAGPNDIVRGLGGNDVIKASQGAPNDIDGGTGTNTAYVDRWDTFKSIQQQRRTSASQSRR